jgi:hypothetical protein
MALRHPDLSQAIWRKSSYSSSTGQNCVEVATNLPYFVAVRDSRYMDGPKLLVSPAAWQFFIGCLKAEHNRLTGLSRRNGPSAP